MELRGRVALVTGVSRRIGIGAAIARELARAGANVFITYFRKYDEGQAWGSQPREVESLLEELATLSQVAGMELDLAEVSAPKVLFDRALQTFGRVDMLINNAAHWEAGGIDAIDGPQLDRHYALNTRAPVLLCAEFARRKLDASPGRIVNITSGQGHAAMPGELAYVVSKAALDALTLTLSAELAPRHITVNAIDPGATDTGWISSEQRSEIERASPLGLIATPEDTARVVRLLVADAAASITGQLIRVQPSARLSEVFG